jgi:hypothetical protein
LASILSVLKSRQHTTADAKNHIGMAIENDLKGGLVAFAESGEQIAIRAPSPMRKTMPLGVLQFQSLWPSIALRRQTTSNKLSPVGTKGQRELSFFRIRAEVSALSAGMAFDLQKQAELKVACTAGSESGSRDTPGALTMSIKGTRNWSMRCGNAPEKQPVFSRKGLVRTANQGVAEFEIGGWPFNHERCGARPGKWT